MGCISDNMIMFFSTDSIPSLWNITHIEDMPIFLPKHTSNISSYRLPHGYDVSGVVA